MRHPAAVPIATALAALLLVGCSSDGSSQDEGDYVAPRATGLPDVSAVTPDNSSVPAGEWALVREVSPEGEETVLAIRMNTVVSGKKGDLADVRGAGDLTFMTPFHVSWTWVAMKGDAASSSRPSLNGGEGVATLSVPKSVERCDPSSAFDFSAELGYEQRGCTVLTSRGDAPTSLNFGSTGGSDGVEFELPAAK